MLLEIGGRSTDDETGWREFAHHKRRVFEHADTDCQIEPFIDEIYMRRAQSDIDGQFRIALQESRDGRRHMHTAEAVGR
jgi:hypothetical protein